MVLAGELDPFAVTVTMFLANARDLTGCLLLIIGSQSKTLCFKSWFVLDWEVYEHDRFVLLCFRC